MKKKILFFLFSLSGGGAERTVVNIINNLDNKKYDKLLVLASSKNNDYIDLLNNDIRIIYLNSIKLRYSLLKLIRCINKEKPNLLFSTINANNIILLLARLLSFRNIPTIVREANNRTQSGTVTGLNKIVTFILYNYISTKVVALSEGVKNDLVKNFNVKKDKIKVIYNPVEIYKINELSKERINDFHRDNKEKIIISVGRLVEQKDYATLIKSFWKVSKKLNARLIILGKGHKKNELINLCNKLKIEDKVLFLGFKKNPYKYMKNADLFVLSSKWEGFGHVIVEAMSLGIPVISTDCKSGPSEIIGVNKYGILVPTENVDELGENIKLLLCEESLLNKYARKGYKRAFDFEATTIIKKYDRLFSKLLV